MKYIVSVGIVLTWAIAFYSIYAWALNQYVPSAYIDKYKYYRGSLMGMISTVLFNGIWIASMIDHMPISIWQAIVAVSAMLLGIFMVVWARRVNPYFIPILAKPARVILEGPYAIVSHPGYLGYCLMSAVPVILFLSPYAGVLALLYNFLLCIRIAEESDLLRYSFLMERPCVRKDIQSSL